MKRLSEENYSDVISEIFENLNSNISKSFASYGYCNIYIATFDTPNNSEVFVNDTSIFFGSEKTCKKILKDILGNLKTTSFILDGDLKEVICVKKTA